MLKPLGLSALFALTIFTSALPAAQAHAQTTSPRPHQRSGKKRTASPLLTGTDGSQTGVANFQGNHTVITAPPGQVLALARSSPCRVRPAARCSFSPALTPTAQPSATPPPA